MVDEMLVSQAKWLPQYRDAITKAEIRLAEGPLVPTKDYRGAARRKVKTVEEMAQDREAASKNAGEADKGDF